MSVSAFGLRAASHSRLFAPDILFCVENTQTAVIFLTIISTKDVKFLSKQSCCMVLNLRSAHNAANHAHTLVVVLRQATVQVCSNMVRTGMLSVGGVR